MVADAWTTWFEQVQRAGEEWAQAQQRLWERVTRSAGSVEESEATKRWSEGGVRSLELLEAAVVASLDAQAEWTKLWAEAVVEAPTTPDFLAEQVERVRDLTLRWTRAQRDVYGRTLAALRAEHAAAGADAQERAAAALRSWQEAADDLVRAQEAWARAMTGADVGDDPGAPPPS